jgi:signal transduction histidine kinase
MSLQGRLLWSLGLAFVLLWLVAAGVLYFGLDQRLSDTLDQRLAASGRMVAGLIARNPNLADGTPGKPLLVWPGSNGTACQIRSQASGKILLRTGGDRGAALSASQPGFSRLDIDGHRWRLYTLKQNGLWITVADRAGERNGLRRGVLLALVLPFALALVGGLAVVWFGVRRGLRPLRRLREELARREPGNLQPVIIGSAPAELVPVTGTLNRLLGQVDDAMRREQRFASQAAHEFRTPLTAIKTHLQIARKVEGARLQVALDDAGQGVARLQRVAEQLLMLARLDSRRDWGEPACRVRGVVKQALADLAEHDWRRVHAAIEDGHARLPLPEALAAVALRNLVDNALQYTPESKRVEIAAQCDAGKVTLRVRDFGGGGTKPPARHGLGLRIVETILDHFGGELQITANEFGGRDSVLHLPAASK